MSFDSIVNRAEFFSDHYLDARLATDLEDLRKGWDAAEGRDRRTARTGLRSARQAFFDARAAVTEASTAARPDAVRALNDVVLRALGFEPARAEAAFSRSSDLDRLTVPVAARVDTATGPLLVAVDAGAASEADELFDTDEREDGRPPGRLLEPLRRDGDKVTVTSVADVPGELFAVDDPPRFVLLCGGSTLLLAERSKWAEGRFLAVELDAALERSDTKAKGELETIAALFSADALVPGHLAGEEDGATSFFDEVDDKQNRHAVGVSKELREGMRRSVEVLANEVIEQRLNRNLAVYTGDNKVDATALTRQCLRYLYRLIVLLYAESRPELGVLPTDDDAYLAGYSLDRLRELVLVELDDEHARHGTHLDESLRVLFGLVNDGYHAEVAEQMLVFDSDSPDATRSAEDYLQFPGLDATIFDPGSTPLLDSVPLRNEALQRVLALLMLNREGKKKSDQRGFISYAQLGINQLGAVYEGLMAYTGFFAQRDQDLFEVAKGGDPSGGTWMVPVDDAADYPDEVFVRETDPITGRTERVRHKGGSFVYRLAGRDRQRSASYYTPEVLTSCVVRHALAELLGTDDHARVPGGSAGITEARQILDLTICEPALGSGAFLNEAINQLSAEYLKRRQAELGETLDAERYQRELQKVKAHFALHQSYGVDLNATAVELAEVSLWLNCMYPGLKAPWFGLRLRRGNSLVGCRRATWNASQLKDKVWAKDKAADAVPPTDRPLSDRLGPDEIHHFLLPGHGWGAVAGRKEAKELAPEQAKSLGEWRKAILKAPSAKDADRLTALAAGVEHLWEEATDLLDRLDQRMRRPLGLYGTDGDGGAPADDRRAAEKILNNPEAALGRLRLVMDAWVGLWFWSLDGEVTPPTWDEWISTLERVIGPEPTEPTGQLDLFADLAAIEAAEAQRASGRVSVAQLLDGTCPWLTNAVAKARREGAWHWPLEFSPLFRTGGFDLQVGNPPWVRPTWQGDQVLGEIDPLMALLDETDPRLSSRRDTLATVLGPDSVFGIELTRNIGLVEWLGSRQIFPDLLDLKSNLYLFFMTHCWIAAHDKGVVGLIHQEIHLSTPGAIEFKRAYYERIKLHAHFRNELLLFEDVKNNTTFSINIYCSRGEIAFRQFAWLFHPSTLDGSIDHNGSGKPPGPKTPDGKWDIRPHADRGIAIDSDGLERFAHLIEPNPQIGVFGRLLLPFLRQEMDVIACLSELKSRLAQASFDFDHGIQPGAGVSSGLLERTQTSRPLADGLVLMAGHISVGDLLSQQPHAPFRNARDYVSIDVESLTAATPIRSNYRMADSPGSFSDGMRSRWRFAWRRRVDQGGERVMNLALCPPGPVHNHSVHSLAFVRDEDTVAVAGLWSSLPIEFVLRVSGKDDLHQNAVDLLPIVLGHEANSALVLRSLRLNCLTPDYQQLWGGLYDRTWSDDRWTESAFSRLSLGDVDPEWTSATPLRRDFERRLALVEIDALAALMLGLSAEQLCAMYRTQFAVLRKYEYAMAFDAEGRKICAHHQSAGYRQGQLQQEAKDKKRGPKWKSVWKMFEQWEEDPDSVDWEGQYTPPFTRPDREAEMTRAYVEFQRRLDAGEYG